MGPMWRAWVNIGQVDFIVNKFSDILLVHISHLYSVDNHYISENKSGLAFELISSGKTTSTRAEYDADRQGP